MAATTRPSDATHEVANQPPPYVGRNLFTDHAALVEALAREGAGWARGRRARAGGVGGGEPIEWARQANENPPKLRTHDRFGNRIDEVEFHPAWHELMRLSVANGVHAGPWRDPREGAHVARAAKMLLISETEFGHGFPISMTY